MLGLDSGNNIPSLRAALIAGNKTPKPLVQDLGGLGIAVGQVWGMTEAVCGVRAAPACYPSSAITEKVVNSIRSASSIVEQS
jgi:hypothetical protein